MVCWEGRYAVPLVPPAIDAHPMARSEERGTLSVSSWGHDWVADVALRLFLHTVHCWAVTVIFGTWNNWGGAVKIPRALRTIRDKDKVKKHPKQL